jgi:hypothetical protein
MTLQMEMLHSFTVWCSVGKLEDLAVDVGIILKGILRKTAWGDGGLNSSGSA